MRSGFSYIGPGKPYGINGRWVSGNYNPYDYFANLRVQSLLARYLQRRATRSWLVSPTSTATSRTSSRWRRERQR